MSLNPREEESAVKFSWSMRHCGQFRYKNEIKIFCVFFAIIYMK